MIYLESLSTNKTYHSMLLSGV